MITTTNKSSIFQKRCFVSPVSEDRGNPCSMECDSPPQEISSVTHFGSPNAPSKYAAQRCIVRNALCVIASNSDADGGDSLSPRPSESKTCHHLQPLFQRDQRNPWNSPDNLDRRNMGSHLLPPLPPPPPRRICFASAENFHPTPIFHMEPFGADEFLTPRSSTKQARDYDKENETRYLYSTPPSSPRRKKPRLSMKRTQQYTLDGKRCTIGMDGTPL